MMVESMVGWCKGVGGIAVGGVCNARHGSRVHEAVCCDLSSRGRAELHPNPTAEPSRRIVRLRAVVVYEYPAIPTVAEQSAAQ
jgi:hypothetical protein